MSPTIPTHPEWQRIIARLHRHYGTYEKLLDVLSANGCETDYEVLNRLCRGHCLHPRWPTGAALLNLHARLNPDLL